ncbi:MAG: ShlB/FhaC/HecB family hemolysin secretion/activation protein [Hyphomonadaceae bacterium]|nr:ShlB/FhaC/HecB family hemolysin secretion/activation protein [Hyphomonadaceae bacterium]
MKLAARAASVALIAAGAAFAQDQTLIIDQDRADRSAPGADAQGLRGRFGEAPPAPPAPPAPTERVMIRAVTIEGGTLSQADLNAAVAPLRDRPLDRTLMSDIARAIASVYARSDVALHAVRARPTIGADGVLRIVVIEQRVDAVTFRGDSNGDIDILRAYAAPLTREDPLSRRTLERAALLMRDVPGVEIELRSAETSDPAVAALDARVTRKRFEYALGADTRGATQLGRTRLQATMTANGVSRLGDETRVTLGASPDAARYAYAAASHRQLVGGDGLSLRGTFSVLQTSPQDGVRGDAQSAGLQAAYPFIRANRRTLTGSASFDALNSDRAVLGAVVAAERTRVLRGSFAYVDAPVGGSMRFGATLSAGVAGLGAGASHPDRIDLDFVKLSAQWGATRDFGVAWRLNTQIGAQASGAMTPASERFALGGTAFGRGFPAAAASGDSGIGASAELAYQHDQNETLRGAYAFLDGGVARLNARPGQASRRQTLASAGGGVRLAIGEDATVTLEAAKALDEPDPDSEVRGWRLNLGLDAKF